MTCRKIYNQPRFGAPSLGDGCVVTQAPAAGDGDPMI